MSLTAEQIDLLNAPLEASRVKPPTDGVFGSYLESYDVINKANEVFGYGGWSSETVITHVPEAQAFLATVTVTAGGAVHSGSCAARYSNPNSVETVSKDAETTALKRALRHWGNQFGNELYDKDSDLHVQAKANAPARANNAPLPNQNNRSNMGTPTGNAPAGGQPARWPGDVPQDSIPENPVCEVSGEPFTGFTSSSGKVYDPRTEAAWAFHDNGRIVKKKYANQ